MRCRKVRSFLSAYCREEISSPLTVKVQRHLEECPMCRREHEAVRSVQAMVKGTPGLKTSDGFSARLLNRVAQERFGETRSKAYLPGRAPRLGGLKLATITVTAMVVLALGVSFNMGDRLLTPTGPQTILSSAPSGGVLDEDRYLKVQPTDNPLLNEHKTISRMVAQYNRWREFSRSLRSHSAAEQFAGGTVGTVMASARSGDVGSDFHVRPVVRNYLIVPSDQGSSTTGRNTY